MVPTCRSGRSVAIPSRVRARAEGRIVRAALQVPRIATPCDLWIGTLLNSGYPALCWIEDGVRYIVTGGQLTLMLAGADLSDPGIIATHACDVKSCVNPDHLRPNSQSFNMVELRERGSCRDQGTMRMEVLEQIVLRSERGIPFTGNLLDRARELGFYRDNSPSGTPAFVVLH